jgi:hypothetical protein
MLMGVVNYSTIQECHYDFFRNHFSYTSEAPLVNF